MNAWVGWLRHRATSSYDQGPVECEKVVAELGNLLLEFDEDGLTPLQLAGYQGALLSEPVQRRRCLLHIQVSHQGDDRPVKRNGTPQRASKVPVSCCSHLAYMPWANSVVRPICSPDPAELLQFKPASESPPRSRTVG